MLTLYLEKRKVLLRLDLSVACFLCVCTDFLSSFSIGSCVWPLFTRSHRHGQAKLLHTQIPQLNSNRVSVACCGRQRYERMYPVMLVRPDGSTVSIRYKEPRRIIMVSLPYLKASNPLACCLS